MPRQYSDWHWGLKLTWNQYSMAPWLMPRRPYVESMLSLAARCLCSLVPARPRAAVTGQWWGVRAESGVSDGVSQWVTGWEAASSSDTQPACAASTRWLTSLLAIASVIFSCHLTPGPDTLTTDSQPPDMSSNDNQTAETLHGWKWAEGSRLFPKSLII